MTGIRRFLAALLLFAIIACTAWAGLLLVYDSENYWSILLLVILANEISEGIEEDLFTI